MSTRKLQNYTGLLFLHLCIAFTALFLFLFLYQIISQGYSVISLEFLIKGPREAMTAGGIFPALIGTLYLVLLSITIAFPLGILTAIYLTHYAKPFWFMQLVRIAINTLAGIPSIIYGLFGMAIFVVLMQLGVSLLSGGLTLAILALPVIINSAEEAIRSVPKEFSEASMALGATKRQTIMRVVLPTALPGILTGTIISIGRVAGETAPIMFTAATFYSRHLPKSLSSEVMALPYHIYALMTEGTHPEQQVPIAYGTAIVLLALVISISFIAIMIRYNIRKTRKW